MNRTIRIVTATVGILSLTTTGCSTMSNTEKGVGLGGLIGAGAGTAIGAATGNPKTGAVVGGLLGAGVGGAVGNQADEKAKERSEVLQAQASAARGQPLGMTDVVRMSQQGVDPGVICDQIRNTGSTYNLSTSDIEYLTQVQVNPRVIQAMQEARPRAAGPPVRERVIYRETPVVYGPPPVYYVEPPPPAFRVYGRFR